MRIIDKGDSDVYITAAGLAEVAGLTVRRIYQLRDSGVITPKKAPTAKHEVYPLSQTLAALLAQKSNIKYSEELTKSRIKIAEESSRKLKMMNDVKAGQLHETADVEKVMSDMLSAFKTRLRGIPAELADKLLKAPDRRTVVKVIEMEINTVCALLSGYNADDFYSRNKDYIDPEADWL